MSSDRSTPSLHWLGTGGGLPQGGRLQEVGLGLQSHAMSAGPRAEVTMHMVGSSSPGPGLL